MRLNTRGTLAARLRKLEERPVPAQCRFLLTDDSTLNVPIAVCLGFICQRPLPPEWEPLMCRIVGLADGEQGGLFMGIVVSMAAWRRSGLTYSDWFQQQQAS